MIGGRFFDRKAFWLAVVLTELWAVFVVYREVYVLQGGNMGIPELFPLQLDCLCEAWRMDLQALCLMIWFALFYLLARVVLWRRRQPKESARV